MMHQNMPTKSIHVGGTLTKELLSQVLGLGLTTRVLPAHEAQLTHRLFTCTHARVVRRYPDAILNVPRQHLV